MIPDISVLAELDRLQLHYEWAGEDEVKIRCPFHQDDKPSCAVSVSKRVFCCHAGSCGRKGDIITLLAQIYERPRSLVMEELSKRYDLDDVKIVEPDVVLRWHEAIWKAGPLLAELYKRAITDKIIKERQLGEENGRITIPIKSGRGDYVNVRKYLPGAPGDQKMRNMRGRGSARWYPEDQLRFDSVVLTGGEMKSLAAAEQLNPHGIGACWVTHGEKAIPPKLAERLQGKSIAWCLDVDAAGRAATDLGARMLQGIASEQLSIVLPLNLNQYPHGDINDFVAAGGDMWVLYQQAEPWQDPTKRKTSTDEPTPIKLAAAANAAYTGRRVKVTALATAADTAPYVVPKTCEAKCTRDQTALCALCSIFPTKDGKFIVSPEDPAVLEVVHSTKRAVHDALMSAAGIPKKCPVVSFEVEDYYNAEDVRLTPEIEITDRTAECKSQPAICIGEGLKLNEPYEMTGRMWPHPQTQQSTLLISSYKQTRDALSTYEPTDEQLATLDVFRPKEWTVESIQAKLDDIYADYELNVTRIFQRRDMHLMMDLAYHSPLLIDVDGDIVKGWVEVLVMGDSRQGKSECALKLMNHYRLGERIECKNATVAGLLGGLKQSGSRWFVEWGFLVKTDKGLLVLEEIKGMDVSVIARLTDARSSGVAELSKIEKTRAHARCRLIWVSNPRGDRTVKSYGHAVDAIRELMGSPEDVARFDACLITEKGEVDANEINRLHAARNGSHARYESDLCRGLVLWAWTRNPKACVFEKAVSKLCLSEATRLSELFSDAVPLVDRGSMRYKLARLAASLAARTFSTDETRRGLQVQVAHVEYVSRWLERLYSRPGCGYLQFSQATRAIDALADPEVIRKNLAALPFPYDFIESMLRADKIEAQDVQDWCSWGREETAALVSLLVRKHALRRDGRAYRKTAAFADFLRDILESRDLPDRPTHIPEEKF